MSSWLSQRVRRHEIARLVCSAALVNIAQATVHMPDGLLGARQQVTWVGGAYALLTLGLSAALVWAWRARRLWARRLTPALYGLHLVAFLPGVTEDPLLAGFVVVWHGGLLLGRLIPRVVPDSLEAQGLSPSAARLHAWLRVNGPAARHLLGFALLTSVAVVGLRLVDGPWVLGTCLGLDALAVALADLFVLRLVRAGRRMALVLLVPQLVGLGLLPWPELALGLLAVFLALALVALWLQGPMAAELADFFLRRPAALAILSFGALIGLGSLLLSFPVASASGQRISMLDALFTATSATCVTGLVVLDTARDFSAFGQGVLLGLIQVGGLGIMVLSTFATLLIGGRLGLKTEHAMAESLGSSGVVRTDRLVMFVVASTLGLEALGAACLTGLYLSHDYALGDAVWRGVFHAVSAFCNAGFALHSDSLIQFQRDPLFLLVIAALISLGGIGFLFLVGAWLRLRRGRAGSLWLTVQVAGWTSLGLVLAGFALIAWTEWDASLAGLPWWHKLSNALFQSVTTRTAGFNSVDLGALAPGTSLVMILLMFVGASPGGTGGGIKTTTFLILLAGVRAIARGETRVVLFGRQVSAGAVYRSLATAMIAAGILVVALLLLLTTQSLGFEALAFEASSALGTVGLSLNVTPSLNPLGKLIITLVMFAGRLGPLTFALLWSRTTEARVGYPEASLPVG
jgi:trk system potassium uptake protein TrkH